MGASAAVRVGFLGAVFIATFHSKLLRTSGVERQRAGVHDLDRERGEAFVGDVTELLDGTTHQVGLVLRRSPAYGLVESILGDTARTGRVMGAMFRDDQVLPTGGRYASAWRAEADEAGSGVLLEHSIHDLDLLDRLLGPVTSVSGQQRSFHEIDGIEDLVVATFELEGGGVATLTTVWHDLPAFISVEQDWFGPVRLTVDGTTQEWSGHPPGRVRASWHPDGPPGRRVHPGRGRGRAGIARRHRRAARPRAGRCRLPLGGGRRGAHPALSARPAHPRRQRVTGPRSESGFLSDPLG